MTDSLIHAVFLRNELMCDCYIWAFRLEIFDVVDGPIHGAD